MTRVRYVPGSRREWNWGEAWVEMPDDGSAPTHYEHRGNRFTFSESLACLVARQAWQRAIDPDMEVDEGL